MRFRANTASGCGAQPESTIQWKLKSINLETRRLSVIDCSAILLLPKEMNRWIIDALDVNALQLRRESLSMSGQQLVDTIHNAIRCEILADELREHIR